MSIEYKYPFKQRKKQKKIVKGKRPRSKPKPEKLPITRLLALAHHYQLLLNNGLVKDYTELAIQTNVSKARISQTMNLLFLAPEIQTALINANMDKLITERQIRKIAKIVLWDEQIKCLNCFK